MGGKISRPVKKMLGKVRNGFNSDKGKVDCGRVSKEKEKEKRPIIQRPSKHVRLPQKKFSTCNLIN